MLNLISDLGRPTAIVFALVIGLALFPYLLKLTRCMWHRPALLVAATLLAVGLPWRSGDETAGLVHVTPADLLSVALVAAVATGMLANGRERRLPRWIAAYLTALTLAMGLSTLLAPDGAESISGLVRYVQVFVLVPLAVFFSIRTDADRHLLLGAAIGLGLFESVIGISQYVGGAGAGFGAESIRATGTFGAFNLMAYPTTVSLALIVCVAIWLTRPHLAILMLPSVLLLGVGLAVSLSRGAWLASLIGISAMLVVTSARRAVAVLATLAILFGGAAITLGGPVADRLLDLPSSVSGADTSVADRYALWEAGLNMFLDRPVFGHGAKSFDSLRDDYAALQFSGGSDISDSAGGYRRVSLNTPHNRYVLTLVEFGLAGGLALGTLLASIFLRILSRIRSRVDEPGTVMLGLVVLGWFVAYLTSGVYGDVGGPTMAFEAIVMGAAISYASGVQYLKRPTTAESSNGKSRNEEDLGPDRSVVRLRSLPSAHGLSGDRHQRDE